MPVPTIAISVNNNDFRYSNELLVREYLFEPQYPDDDYCVQKNTKSKENIVISRLTNKKTRITVIHPELSSELLHIQESIEEAKYITALDDNWDSEGAIKIPEYIFERASNFLKNYATYIFEKYETIIDAPTILPLKDGSIDLSWNNKNANLLINIKNTNSDIAFYYGELFIDDEQILDINGQIATTSPIDKFASWFTNLSKMEKKEYSY